MNFLRIKNLKESLGNLIKTSRIYWSYRHIFEKNVWDDYIKNSETNRCEFYNKIYRENNMLAVFEFGCASGPNLISLKREFKDLIALGYDINRSAVATGNKYLVSNNLSDNVMLTSSLDLNSFKKFLLNNKLEKFDMAIFDRVLYLLDEKDLQDHMLKYSPYYKLIVIDDFLPSDSSELNSRYRPRDYIKILRSYNFNVIDDSKSDHITSSNVDEAITRRLVFINNQSK